MTLNWFPPRYDGGAAIISYIVERRDSLHGGWTRIARCKPHQTMYVAGNLMEGVKYAFRVFAENIEGLSEPLETEDHVTPHRPASKYATSAGFSPSVKLVKYKA